MSTGSTSLPVASVRVAPNTATVQQGRQKILVATTLDTAGNQVTGRTTTWNSDNPATATVSEGGVVTGAAPGTATITATSEGQSGTATVTVTAPTPTSTPTLAPTPPPTPTPTPTPTTPAPGPQPTTVNVAAPQGSDRLLPSVLAILALGVALFLCYEIFVRRSREATPAQAQPPAQAPVQVHGGGAPPQQQTPAPVPATRTTAAPTSAPVGGAPLEVSQTPTGRVHRDPNRAGIQEEYAFVMPATDGRPPLWLPRGFGPDRPVTDPIEIPLRAGHAYNIRCTEALPANVEIGSFGGRGGNHLECVTALRAWLESPGGFDFYPREDSFLVMRWTRAVEGTKTFTFQVKLLTATPQERLQSRRAMPGQSCH
ncbi:MAG: Ig domain-containing protein [Parcubacteria group bacterium Gr01-1014_38]|nr:MAG: Ig domain-containing protein [Parcubacteria group bacterium Gr01-1014_38]